MQIVPRFISQPSTGLWLPAYDRSTRIRRRRMFPSTYVSSTRTDKAADTNFSISYTISGGSNRGLLVYIHSGSTALSVTSVSWNTSEALTLLTEPHSDDDTGSLWGIKNPTVGTANVDIVTVDSAQLAVIIVDFTGVDQTTPFGTPVGDAYSVSDEFHSHNTVGVTNGIICDFFSLADAAGAITVNGGQTTQQAAVEYANWKTIFTTAAGASSVSTGYSWPSPFFRWVHATVCVNPASNSVTRIRHARNYTPQRRATLY